MTMLDRRPLFECGICGRLTLEPGECLSCGGVRAPSNNAGASGLPAGSERP